MAVPADAQEVTNELYGSFQYAASWMDPAEEVRWTAVDNASRVGVRGSVAHERLEAFYHLEAGALVNTDGRGFAVTQRFFLAGLRTDVGTLTVGRLSPSYKMAGLELDPFYDTSALDALAQNATGPVAAGATFGLSRLTNGWSDRTLQYVTPELTGVSALVAVHPGGEDGADLGVGVRYGRDGLGGGLEYRRERSDGANWTPAAGIEDALRGHVLIDRGEGWSLGFSGERLKPLSGESQRLMYATGKLRATERLELAAAVGDVGAGDAGHPEGTGVHLGGFVDLLPGARGHLLYSGTSLAETRSRHALAVGVSLGFSWGHEATSEND